MAPVSSSSADETDNFYEKGETRDRDHENKLRVPRPGLELSYGIEDYVRDCCEEEEDDEDEDIDSCRRGYAYEDDDRGDAVEDECDDDDDDDVVASDSHAAPPSTTSDNNNVVPPPTPRRRSVVSFAAGPRVFGGDSTSNDGSCNDQQDHDDDRSPLCGSLIVAQKKKGGRVSRSSWSNNAVGMDDHDLRHRRRSEATTTEMDGVSFGSSSSCCGAPSSVEGGEADVNTRMELREKNAQGQGTVDVVPSTFAGRTSAEGDKKGSSSYSFRSLKRRRRQDPQRDVFRQDRGGTSMPTASMTGRVATTRGGNDAYDNKHRKSSSVPRTRRALLCAKSAFFLFLLVVALGTARHIYYELKTTEADFAESRFRSIAARALRDSADVVSRKRLSMATMATVIGENFREGGDWPNVAVEGYERIVSLLARTGSHTDMGFAPLVEVSEQPSFESFAYDHFASRPDYYPPNTGINSPDWRGVWRMTPNKTRVHDADEVTVERGGTLTPILQCCISNPGDRVLLFNLRSEPQRRKTIDGIVACAGRMRAAVMARASRENNIFADDLTKEGKSTSAAAATPAPPPPDYACGSMTDFVKIVRFKTRGPASIMFQPISPADSPWEMRGLVLSPMAWDEVLESVFASDVDGVHAVLESETMKHTYTIANGKVESFQEGDIHQTEFDEFGVSTNLTWNDLHEMGAPMYKLSMYPTDDFVESYSTSNPRNATVAALCVILFISFLFLVYDYFVRREFLERHQLLEAKRRFIRFVSHEVRTPLNAVLMGLNIIEAEMAVDSRQDGGQNQQGEDSRLTDRLLLLREIQYNTESAVEVLNDVLLYDDIESALNLEVSMVHIWHVVERSLSEFKLPAQRQGVHLRATYETSTTDGDCPYDVGCRVSDAADLPDDVRRLRAAGDPSRITQVLRNLLSNALKFTSEQGSIIVTASYHMASMVEGRKVNWKGGSTWVEKIELHNGQEVLATPRGHFQLTVQDTGVGMSPDQVNKLFGEGVQFNAHDLQAGKGSGLGLFIAKGLVNQHKGTLEATSEGLDKGAVFTLKLPLYHVPGLSSENEEQHETTSVSEKEILNDDDVSSFGEGENQRLRLLVVDDHPSNRKLLCQLLESKGHKCDTAENGQVALEMVRETMWSSNDGGNKALEPYDSILMDYEMPVMNGPTASSLIRELGSDVFIVGITGNVLSDDVRYFKSRGANAILTKPFQLSTLEDLFMEYQLMY